MHLLLLSLLCAGLARADPVWIWRSSSVSLAQNEFCLDYVESPTSATTPPLTLACRDPRAKIARISFASFGLPLGGCELPRVGLCHADNTSSVLETLCVGRNSCTLPTPLASIWGQSCSPSSSSASSNSLFTPTKDKRLVVVAGCDEGEGVATPSPTATALNPENTFTYFRADFNLSSAPSQPLYVGVAADSNTAVFINGVLVSRKVTRYKETNITFDRVILPTDSLVVGGVNTLVFRHFSWGNIETFQRTGEQHAGLWVTSNFGLSSGTDGWECLQAPEYTVHSDQVQGVAGGAYRIRFPQLVDGRAVLPPSCFVFPHDGCPEQWQGVAEVTDGPWPPGAPAETETSAASRFQGGTLDWAEHVLAAGVLSTAQPVSPDPYSIAKGIGSARYMKDDTLTAALQSALDLGTPLVLSGAAGQSMFLTVDFFSPKHGYPVVEFAAPTSAGVVVDFGYGEKAFDLYTGDAFVTVDGWLNPEGVVGTGYADRYTTTNDDQRVELPDERTARWLVLNIHFAQDGNVSIAHLGMQQWMFLAAATGPDGTAGPIGSFECGDPVMDQIVQLSLTHAYISMSDTYVDCPGREDGQWMEDARPRALIAASWFNDSSLRRIMVRHQAEMQSPDGGMHPFPPSNFPASASVDWSVQWVATMYDDWKFTGRTDYISRFWPQLVKYWNHVLADLRPDGMWTGSCLNDIRITPGCPSGTGPCSSGMVTPWIIERLNFSAWMAQAVGQADQAAKWLNAASQMTTAFLNHHVVTSGAQPYVSAVTGLNGRGQWIPSPQIMQAAQGVAVFTGLLNASLAKAVMDTAFSDPQGDPPAGVLRWNNPTYLRRSLKALSYVNQTGKALRHLKERFSQYLPNDPRNPTIPALQGPAGGPLPEYWISRVDLNLGPGQRDNAQPVDGTGSHGWVSVGLLWLHTHVLGVTEPNPTPTPALLRVAPDDGGVQGQPLLPYVRGRTFTSRGLVSVDWEPRLGGLLSVTLPDSTPTVIVRPNSCASARGWTVVSVPPGGQVTAQDDASATVTGTGVWQLQC